MKYFLTACFLMTSILVTGQTNESKQNKTIAVVGKAEIEIVPDEIYIAIALKEYKDGPKKITINALEKNLVNAIEKLKIDKNDLKVDNLYGYNWDWRKKKSDEFLATKSFTLKINDVRVLNELVDNLDAEGINSMSVNKVTHSKIEEYKEKLQAQALKNAKEKAMMLLSSIDEELGHAVLIEETPNHQNVYYSRNAMAMKSESFDGGYKSDIDIKNISLSAEIRAVFTIK